MVATTPNDLAIRLGQRLRAQRLALRWSRADLARQSGLSLGTITKLEKFPGTVSFENLLKVVYALGLESGLQSLFLIRARSAEDFARLAQATRPGARPVKRQIFED
jgi:transcriptional regulator with XRE-family HTH domain